ncbi:MAG: AMP-binding protein [Betaproteobacteria bacterium]|nr:AMP-binding protein [Betaproteobacteria bacterium]
MNAAQALVSVGEDGRTALACGDERLSYGALRETVARAGGAWRGLGLLPGGRVMVFAPDSIEWVVAYLGAMWMGGVPIGVNSRLNPRDLPPLIAESEIRYVWCEADAGPAIAQATSGLPVRPRVLVPGGALGCEDWRQILAHAPKPDAVRRDPEDIGFWIGTSGTTGLPKAVIHAQRAAKPCDAFARGVLGLTRDDRLYATSKLFFAYALANSLFAGLRLGATVILDRDWPTPERVLENVKRHRPTALFSVPTLYRQMLQKQVAAEIAALGIRHYVSAGEALPAPVRSAWAEATGKQPVSGYGTTETLCLMLYCPDASRRLRPTPLTEVRYDEGHESGVPQRIRVRHPAVAKGYWKRPKDETEGFAEGWFLPGDMFLRNDDGTLDFAGRTDDMLKVSGQWVSTLAVEQALLEACGDAVAELGAVGVQDADGLSAVGLCVVAAPGREQDAKARLESGIEKLPKFKRPRVIRWIQTLPRTPTGKLQRRKLQELI